MKPVYTGSQLTRTSLRNGGRIAGSGIAHDNYDDESGNTYGETYRPMVRFPNDNIKPEELSGPCVIVQKGKVV